MAGKQRQQSPKRIGERQGVCHMVRPDSVQPDVERIESGARIDQYGEGLNVVIGLNAGDADLADAGGIAASCLHIECNESEVAIWDEADMLKVWAKSGDHILDCRALWGSF